jgi:hypothetical protein
MVAPTVRPLEATCFSSGSFAVNAGDLMPIFIKV